MGRPSYCARATMRTASAVESWLKWAHTPVCRTRARSRATATVSAASGMPGRPSRVLTWPSCTQPLLRSHASSGCRNTVRLWVAAYSIARRSTSVLVSARRPLLTLLLLVVLCAFFSLLRSPARPCVRAPSGSTRARPALRARCCIRVATAGVSITGSQSGGAHKVVTPPLTAAGVAEMGAQINEPGADHQAAHIDFFVGGEAVGRRAHRGEAAVGDPEVADLVDLVGRVDHAAVAEHEAHQATFPSTSGILPMHMAITAMRTAMPWVTCCRITERGPSATLDAISTPRLMGPGCMTMASGLAAASRSSVRPYS